MIRTWTPESETPTPPGGVDYRTVKAWFQQCRDLAALSKSKSKKYNASGTRQKNAPEPERDACRWWQWGQGGLCCRAAGHRAPTTSKDGDGPVQSACRGHPAGILPDSRAGMCRIDLRALCHRKISQGNCKRSRRVRADVVYRRIKRGCMALAEIWDEFSDVQSVQHAQENTA